MNSSQGAKNRGLIAFTVMLPTLIEIIDTSIVNVSLEHIRGALSASIEESTWAISAYLVSNAIVIPMAGWLSRLMGRKNYLLASIGLFTFSSFLCGSAWSLPSLVFFRILQGIGGGGLVPVSQSILLEAFPPHKHGTAMAIFGLGAMFGPITGPLLGGWITDNWSWRWIFYINIPIGIFSIIMNLIVIEDPPYMKRAEAMRVDWAGLGLLAVGLGSLQFILDKGQQEDWFASDLISTLAAVSVISLILLAIQELYSKEPIVNLRLFKDRTFASGSTVMFFVFFNLFASIVLLPIYLQTLMGYTSFHAGLVLGPGGAATLLAMPIVGNLVNRVNPKRILFFGVLVCAYTTWEMSQFNLQTDFWRFVWPRVTLGIGMGLSFIPLTVLTLSHIPRERMTEATALYNLLRNLGGSVGIAFTTTLLSRRAQLHQSQLVEHLTPFDPMYQMARGKASAILGLKGLPEKAADGKIYGEMVRQAYALAFNDTFLVVCALMLCVIPLVVFMKRSRPRPHAGTVH